MNEIPNQEYRDTSLVLEELQAVFNPSSPFVEGLINSLTAAQLKAIAPEKLRVNHETCYVLNYRIPVEAQIMLRAYNSRLTEMRRHMPVLITDLDQIRNQKGSQLELEDVYSSLAATINTIKPSLSRNHFPLPSREGQEILYPFYLADHYNPNEKRISYFQIETLIKDFITAHHQIGLDLGISAQYPMKRDKASEVVMNLISENYEDIQLNRENRIILITKTALDECLQSYASPWITKIGFAQLLDLDTSRITRLATKFRKSVDPQSPAQLRLLIADYGSGKTFTLNRLKELQLAGVAFINGHRPFKDQAHGLKQQVIFIDEAVNLNPADITTINEQLATAPDTVIIFLCPNLETAKQVQYNFS